MLGCLVGLLVFSHGSGTVPNDQALVAWTTDGEVVNASDMLQLFGEGDGTDPAQAAGANTLRHFL
jgi:hypothetical protein